MLLPSFFGHATTGEAARGLLLPLNSLLIAEIVIRGLVPTNPGSIRFTDLRLDEPGEGWMAGTKRAMIDLVASLC